MTGTHSECAVLLLLDEQKGLSDSMLVYGALRVIAGFPYLINHKGACIPLPESFSERVLDTPVERQKLFMGCPKFVVASKEEACALTAALEIDDGWDVFYPAENYVQ